MINLLLLPGVLCDNTLWSDIAPVLKEKFQIYHAAIPREASVAAMAQEALRHAPSKFWAVGFSLGGWVALEAVHMQPERVEGLILINTSDGNLLPATRIAMKKAITEMLTGGFEQYVNDSLGLYLTEEHSKNAVICNRMRKMMYSVGPEMASQQYAAMVNLQQPFDFLNAIDCPTLIIRGEQDRRHTLAMDQEFCSKIPNAELSIIRDAAHFISIEQPQALANKIQDFIRSVINPVF